MPWALGPPDGRYLLRGPGATPDEPPTQVLVLATLGAPQRRGLIERHRRRRDAPPQPEPAPVATGRATVIDVSAPLPDVPSAERWLAGAGEPDLAADLAVLNRALNAFRLVTADPYLSPVGREQALVARIGYGAGDQVADGLWTAARELLLPDTPRRRAKVLQPQARLAAILNGRERALVCEELVLRARLDLDQGRERECALGSLVALDAALAELPRDATGAALSERIGGLRAQREPLTEAAQAALAGELGASHREVLTETLRQLEAALRARAVASA